jgi:ParB family chromosome partitioning protein
MAKNALGKGLGALIGGPKIAQPVPVTEAGESIRKIPVESIDVSPYQPRKVFSEEELLELSDSIRVNGILTPLIVRKVGDRHELIAGERRWRAAQRLGLDKVPAIVRAASNQEAAEWALIENLQRADLNPMEEAEGYERLIQQFKLTQEQVAQQVGKSRAAVANALRLRNLAPDVQALVGKNLLSVGHAKVILGVTDAAQQTLLANRAVKESLTVRQVEVLVNSLNKIGGKKPKAGAKSGGVSSGADWRDLELRLQRTLGTKVKLVGTGSAGKVEIHYFNSADLDRILNVLGAGGGS